MTDIIDWTPNERELFTHKLEELINGPNPTRKIGFILAVFPVTEQNTHAKVFSNANPTMVANVLYNVLQGIMEKKNG